MDIEQARSILLALILDILGYKPTQQENNEITYPSVFSQSKTGNLIVNTDTNTWHDSGTGQSGDTLSLVTGYLETQGENHTVKDALRWIEIMCGYATKIEPIPYEENIPKYSSLTVIDADLIRHPLLIRYLNALELPLEVAQRYLKEIRIYDRKAGKSFRALGFENEDGGYFAFNEDFTGFVGKGNISFIRGTIPKPEVIHIFKNVFDFMTVLITLQDGRPLLADAVILNSYGNLPKATPFIKGYGYRRAFSWLGNDAPGRKATRSLSRFFKTESDLAHSVMKDAYAPHENVHAWHMGNSHE